MIAPHTPLVALAGPKFTRDLTLRSFCGEPVELLPEEAEPDAEPEARRDVTRGEEAEA